MSLTFASVRSTRHVLDRHVGCATIQRHPTMKPVCMRSAFALFAWMFVWSTAATTALQGTLHYQGEDVVVVGARKIRQPNRQAPLELSLPSGTRITIPPQDVHAPATTLVRHAMASQAYRAVEPSLLFVLIIRELAPLSESDVKVTLSSGAVIRVRSNDVNDVRLTFLRTMLVETDSARTSHYRAVRTLADKLLATAGVRLSESATAAAEPTERAAPAGAQPPAQAGAPPPGVEIQCGAAKPDSTLEPWTRGFTVQIRRNWFIPAAAMSKKGHVGLRFLVHKDGRITDLTVYEASSVAEFNNSAFNAVAAANPTQPLPPEYPPPHITICVTFYFNEAPKR